MIIERPPIAVKKDTVEYNASAFKTKPNEDVEGLLKKLPGVELIAPVQANGVFVDLPVCVIETVRAKGWRFYNFVGATGVRFMCAWDTPLEAVDRFAADIAQAIRESGQ